MARKKIRLGMVGGGPGSFIGPVHAMAAALDGRFEVVAGAFSSSAERSRGGAATYGVDPDRGYSSIDAMITAEAGRDDGIQAVCITAPNYVHALAATAAARAGLAVISDKPATATLAEAVALRDVLKECRTPYGLTYTYTGYSMIREARSVCAEEIGRIRKAVVEYPQGWLSRQAENEGLRQAVWRTDPRYAGNGGCISDIGVHAFNILEFVTCLRVNRLCAQLSSVVEGRVLDDDCNMLLELGQNAVPAVIQASQIAAGARNGLRVRVWGELGGIDWCHESPDRLLIEWASGRSEIRHAGSPDLCQAAIASRRLPSGHPEGFIEAFATIYRDFADMIEGHPGGGALVPTIEEGVRGMAFVERAVESSAERRWVDLSV